jgi:hypothetical protein
VGKREKASFCQTVPGIALTSSEEGSMKVEALDVTYWDRDLRILIF